VRNRQEYMANKYVVEFVELLINIVSPSTFGRFG
jgi:hypothetical protein